MRTVRMVDAEAHTLSDPQWRGEPQGEGGPFAMRYDARDVLGEGGMGQVGLHLDCWMGREVALKVLHRHLQSDGELHARFMREARIQGQLEHPSVVPVYDLGVTSDGVPYFTMRRVQGKTLGEIIAGLAARNESISAEYNTRKLLGAFERVCLAVHYAHERGVLHRDLKPENVMLGDFGEVYVLDWGIARATEEAAVSSGEDAAAPVTGGSIAPPSTASGTAPMSVPSAIATQAGTVMGTPGYMAPEQIAGEIEAIGPAADIYSLGVLLFEILTRRHLHLGANTAEMMIAAVSGVDQHLQPHFDDADVPPELRALCQQALALAPEHRPKTARDMHDAIERYLAGERDTDMRQQAAEGHADAAAAMFEAGDDVEARRRAMREVGRALALDPDNRRAAETLLRILERPPSEVPDEVKEAGERGYVERLSAIGRVAALCYVGMLGFLPVALVVGIKMAWPFAAFFGLCLLAAAGAWRVHHNGSQTLALVSLVASSAGCAATAWVYGPLILAPQAVIINAMIYLFVLRPKYLLTSLTVATLAIVAPIVAELTGLSRSYRPTADGLVIVEQAMTLDHTTMLVFGLVASVFGLLAGAVSAVYYHRRLADAELQLYLRDWHLRQMIGAGEA